MAYLSADDLGASLGLGPQPGKQVSRERKPQSAAKHNSEAIEKDPVSDDLSDVTPKLFDKVKQPVKDYNLTIRIYGYEIARWKKAAKQVGVSTTEFIETVINDYCDRNSL